MTREEEIEKILDDKFDTDLYDYKTDNSYCNYCAGFIEGAEWADAHPVNVWHDASEEPVKDTHILIENSFFEDDLDYYSCHWSTSICPSWEEYVKEYNIKRWACISDLLPKGGEK